MQYDKLEVYSLRLDAIVESAYEGIIAVDHKMNLTFMNSAARSMFDYSMREAEKLTLNELIPDKHRHKHNDYVMRFRKSQERSRPMQTRMTVKGKRKGGEEFPLEISISKIVVNGKMEFVGVIRDVSERSKLLEELTTAATIDHLTGLANKRLFEQEMQHQMTLNHRYKRGLALIVIDLDYFKLVNDSYGHSTGDEVLMRVASILKKEIRESDLAARWGGEEFALLLSETDIQGAVNLAEQLRQAIAAQKFNANKQSFSVTASFGVVSSTGGDESSQCLFDRADALLYEAKNAGRNCIKPNP
ncbi:MAG: diguanylate cyclase [Aestuariibacter sp.]